MRTRLLLETLEFAATRSPYYRERLGHLTGQVKTLDDLIRLPTTTKADLSLHSLEMLTSTEFPARMGLSSGTTHLYGPGPPAVCYQSHEDVQMHNEMQDRLRPRGNEVLPLTALIIHAMHGGAFGNPPPGCLLVPMEKSFHLAHLRQLLAREFHFDGYSQRLQGLCGSLNILKLLATLLTMEHGSSPYPTALRSLFCYGFHLSRRWRRFIEEAFGAPLVDMYGVSEVIGATCSECPVCSDFHLPPVVIPEILKPGTEDQRVEEGVGELCLTSLVPFQTMQPLIRYRTGDYVRISGVCELSGEIAFRPIGRVTKSLYIDGFGVVLPSGLAYEVIDDLPIVARTPYRHLHSFGAGPLFGTPNFRVRDMERETSGGTATAVLEIETDLLPMHFPDYFAEIASSLRRKLLGLTDAGSSAAASGQFDVRFEFVPRGTITNSMEMFH